MWCAYQQLLQDGYFERSYKFSSTAEQIEDSLDSGQEVTSTVKGFYGTMYKSMIEDTDLLSCLDQYENTIFISTGDMQQILNSYESGLSTIESYLLNMSDMSTLWKDLWTSKINFEELPKEIEAYLGHISTNIKSK